MIVCSQSCWDTCFIQYFGPLIHGSKSNSRGYPDERSGCERWRQDSHSWGPFGILLPQLGEGPWQVTTGSFPTRLGPISKLVYGTMVVSFRPYFITNHPSYKISNSWPHLVVDGNVIFSNKPSPININVSWSLLDTINCRKRIAMPRDPSTEIVLGFPQTWIIWGGLDLRSVIHNIWSVLAIWRFPKS